METKDELASTLETLEDEYRFWVIEAIQMGRGIETMEEELTHRDSELGADRAADLRRRLFRVREKHEEIEEKIHSIRQRLDELRERLDRMP